MFNFLSFIDPSYRIHWVYVLPALLISVFFLKSLKLFTFKYIFNRSLFLDIKLFTFNQVFKFFIVLPAEGFLVFSLSKVAVSHFESAGYFEHGQSVILIFTVFSFLIDDLFKFLQHFLMHKVPFLWEFHKVHHSAPTLNPMTLYRLHFIEIVIAFLRRLVSTSLTVILVLFLCSEMVSPISIMGIHAATFLFSLIGSNLRHSHLPISFGVLDYIFISPAQHQIHHSKNKRHHDKNFGVTLALWDHLTGSFLKSSGKQKLSFGLSYSERNHSYKSFSSAVIDPFKIIFKHSTKKDIFKPSTKKLKLLSWGIPMKNYITLIVVTTLLGCGGSGEVGLSGTQQVSPSSFSIQKYGDDLYKRFYKTELKSVDALLVRLSETSDSTEQKKLVRKVILNYQKITPFQYKGHLGELVGETYNYELVYSGAFSLENCELLKLIADGEKLDVAATLNNIEFLTFRSRETLCNEVSVSNDQIISAVKAEALRMRELIRPDIKTLSEDDGTIMSKNALQDAYDMLTLFLDRELKDKKLAGSSGQDPLKSFKGQTCSICAEHKNSDLSYAVLTKNFEALYFIFTQERDFETPTHKGLYQYLVINGFSSLAEDIKDLLKKGHSLALFKAEDSMFKDSKSLSNPEAQQRCSNKDFSGAELCELYWISKKLSDLTKVDLKAAMSVSSVVHGAGDGD